MVPLSVSVVVKDILFQVIDLGSIHDYHASPDLPLKLLVKGVTSMGGVYRMQLDFVKIVESSEALCKRW